MLPYHMILIVLLVWNGPTLPLWSPNGFSQLSVLPLIYLINTYFTNKKYLTKNYLSDTLIKENSLTFYADRSYCCQYQEDPAQFDGFSGMHL